MESAAIKRRKNADKPLVCLTAYGAPMAKIIAPHVDMILVGDSVGMVLYGMDNTLGVTLDMMVNHTAAVRRGAGDDTFIVADMPAGTYENDMNAALKNAQILMNKGGANAVKLEGGASMANTIAHLVQCDIPVMAHIGLLPQAVEREGGYKIKGKTNADTVRLIDDARAVAAAGAFCFVLEGTIERAARAVTAAVDIPSIGIGASLACDGQILVTEDMLGLSGGYVPKFAKIYENMAPCIENIIATHAAAVRGRTFPNDAHVYKG